MKYTWAGASHVGRSRSNNEDAIHPEGAGGGTDDPILVAVADGMGGHVAGEVASRTAIDAAVAEESDASERVRAANRAVVEATAADPDLAGMGTTMTLALLHADGRAEIAHIGDSRAYLVRKGDIDQVSQDHTYVAELVAAGRLDEEDARSHPQRNLLSKVLGLQVDIRPDTVELELQDGDRLVLCSDGLTDMLHNDEIADIVTAHDDPSDAAWGLVEAANDAGGDDNISVVVVFAAA